MFKIHRSETPTKLSKINKIFNKEIEQFATIEDKYNYFKMVKTQKLYKYNTTETKEIFKQMNYCRCSICTQYISVFDKSMTVEHIQLKSQRPDLIFEWSNLLCCCRVCNTNRSTNAYDPNLYIDPTIDESPERYFKIKPDGTITPEDGITNDDINRANYMINIYKLNEKSLKTERKHYYESLLKEEEENKERLLRMKNKDKQDLKSDVLFLNIFTYYMERIK